MSERIDVLEASYDAVRIELDKTQRVIDYLERRATRLREALESLDRLVNSDSAPPDADSVSRVMDQLQQTARPEGEGSAGERAAEGKKPAAKESAREPVPTWLKGEGAEKKAAAG